MDSIAVDSRKKAGVTPALLLPHMKGVFKKHQSLWPLGIRRQNQRLELVAHVPLQTLLLHTASEVCTMNESTPIRNFDCREIFQQYFFLQNLLELCCTCDVDRLRKNYGRVHSVLQETTFVAVQISDVHASPCVAFTTKYLFPHS